MQNTLLGSQLFCNLNGAQLQTILPLCVEITAKPQERLFTEGESAAYLYVVESGRVGLIMTLPRPDGSVIQPTTVASVGPRRGLWLVGFG